MPPLAFSAELPEPIQTVGVGPPQYPRPRRFNESRVTTWAVAHPEPVLIDCPPLTEASLEALQTLAAGHHPRILLTSREGHGRIRRLQERLGWPVLVQEQEAYLLPGVHPLETFQETHTTAAGLRLLWTPGPSPGSCVVHAPAPWNLLFCGRLLIPVAMGTLAPLRHRRTLHWPRQQRSLTRLSQWLPADQSPALASGAGLGALRGERLSPWSSWTDTNATGECQGLPS